jgi:hypothetical protein
MFCLSRAFRPRRRVGAVLTLLFSTLAAAFVPAPSHALPFGRFDLNGDLRSDVLMRNRNSGALFGFLTAGAAGLIWAGDPAWDTVAIQDLNNDNKSDIVLRNRTTGQIYYFVMDGLAIASGGSFWEGGDNNWEFVTLGDFNGDRQRGALLRNKNTGALRYHLFGGGSVTVWAGGDNTWNAIQGVVMDLNKDGRDDIIMRNQVTGALFGFLTGGAAGLIWEGDPAWFPIAYPDFNGDGTGDILLYNFQTEPCTASR